MHCKDDLDFAVDLQKRSYNLLRWLSDAVSRGFISFQAAHEYSSLPISTAKWIESHYENIPPESRPRIEDLKQFSNFFSTYLKTSFELVSAPAKMRTKDWCCSFCNIMVDAPHLITKKTTRSDKTKARKMRVAAIKRLASESGFFIEDEFAGSVADDPALRETTALVAYKEDLLRRLKGDSAGPAVLILWRGFAWTKEGAPKKNFNLDTEIFLEAHENLKSVLSIANGKNQTSKCKKS